MLRIALSCSIMQHAPCFAISGVSFSNGSTFQLEEDLEKVEKLVMRNPSTGMASNP